MVYMLKVCAVKASLAAKVIRCFRPTNKVNTRVLKGMQRHNLNYRQHCMFSPEKICRLAYTLVYL